MQPAPAIDYGLAGASTALMLADWSQTLQVAAEPVRYHEFNPLLGRHPSVGRANTYFGLTVAANLGALLLPKGPRRIWYAAIILIEGIVVTRNLTHGLTIGF